MAYEQKPNSGSLFKNDRKREGKNDSDYTGKGVVEGNDVWIDAWIKNNPKSPDHDPDKPVFMSLSFRPRQPKN
tara:strand:+ start:3430 stop:3648 length:219 start_codon:yes stop_codon:yes gene_type:complete